MINKITLIALGTLLIFGCSPKEQQAQISDTAFENLTSEPPIKLVPNLGKAAEAYYSPDGKSFICNAKIAEDDAVHHVYTATTEGTNIKRINHLGEDACSYYYPSGDKLIWTSTRDYPDVPVGNWSVPTIYPQGAELYSSDLNGENIVRLTNNMNYDAEVSVSPDGKWILFTRQVDGKLDLWKMKSDGTGEHQITFTDGWQEGGSFYLPDSKTILYRAWKKEFDDARAKPMTIFTINHDGSDLKQITFEDDETNWAPHPGPDGKHFVFVKVLPPHNFEIYMMNIDSGKQTRLTYSDAFDGFPVMSPDGKSMLFSSSRNAKPGDRSLNLFVMDLSSLYN